MVLTVLALVPLTYILRMVLFGEKSNKDNMNNWEMFLTLDPEVVKKVCVIINICMASNAYFIH